MKWAWRMCEHEILLCCHPTRSSPKVRLLYNMIVVHAMIYMHSGYRHDGQVAERLKVSTRGSDPLSIGTRVALGQAAVS